jgi:hypothetical protein
VYGPKNKVPAIIRGIISSETRNGVKLLHFFFGGIIRQKVSFYTTIIEEPLLLSRNTKNPIRQCKMLEFIDERVSTIHPFNDLRIPPPVDCFKIMWKRQNWKASLLSRMVRLKTGRLFLKQKSSVRILPKRLEMLQESVTYVAWLIFTRVSQTVSLSLILPKASKPVVVSFPPFGIYLFRNINNVEPSALDQVGDLPSAIIAAISMLSKFRR